MDDPTSEVMALRNEGLNDSVIMEELSKKGYSPDQINLALMNSDQGSAYPSAPGAPGMNMGNDMGSSGMPQMSDNMYSGYPPQNQQMGQDSVSNIYERIQEITESMIDEKWDELIVEVRKIIDWKNKFEEKQMRMQHELEKLKEDFKTLHQGVLGKLDDYDDRMQDVGTELNALGKVFKDVVPQFVENVKELNSITDRIKK